MSPRTRQEDAARKREARAKLRNLKESQQVVERSAEESRARALAWLQRETSPQRDAERVARAIELLRQAESAAHDLEVLACISSAVRDTLGSEFPGGLHIFRLPSWDGVRWRSAADIRQVLTADLAERGLLQAFEQQITRGAVTQ